MPAPRLAVVVALLLAACAGWDSASPSYTPPPVDGPTPSHYAPPPPYDPDAPTTTTPDAPRGGVVRVAIASVQLIEDCPEPAAAAADVAPGAASERAGPAGRSMKVGEGYRRPCTQSTVQLAVTSDRPGQFRVEAVRVLDAASQKVAGTARLRGPTRWDDGTYAPWDERVLEGKELKISYKLDEPDTTQAQVTVGPDFNPFMGPFILELDVSVDGKRQTIRSGEFSREPPHMVVT